MVLWMTWSACAVDTGGRNDADTGDRSETLVTHYPPDSGVACIEGPAGTRTDVIVDFGDCLFCSESTLWCEATLKGTTVVVHAAGSVSTRDDCQTGGTCVPTHAVCDGPMLEPGDYTLSYGGVEVPFTLPAGTWTCTGESGVL